VRAAGGLAAAQVYVDVFKSLIEDVDYWNTRLCKVEDMSIDNAAGDVDARGHREKRQGHAEVLWTANYVCSDEEDAECRIMNSLGVMWEANSVAAI